MRSDSDIKRDVEDELRWDPDLDSTDIAVTVKSGVVTLVGFTRSYSDKLEAEAAAKRVAGVLGVANDIEVRLPALDQRPDPEIARDAIAAIKNRVPVVAEQIKVLVRNGWITLEGEGRVGLSTLGGRERCAAGEGPEGRYQHDPGQTARSGWRDQAQDRGSLPPQRGNRRQPHHRRSP
jgi:osmotically-inducible protein OsmY